MLSFLTYPPHVSDLALPDGLTKITLYPSINFLVMETDDSMPTTPKHATGHDLEIVQAIPNHHRRLPSYPV